MTLSKDTPRLSELPGNGTLDRCAFCCRQEDAFNQLERWLEHNHFDQPEPRVVILCAGCAGKIIEPHERLYRKLLPREFIPGSGKICLDCKHQVKLRCLSPRAKFNGGPGLDFDPSLYVAHINAGRASRWVQYEYQAVTKCTGKET